MGARECRGDSLVKVAFVDLLPEHDGDVDEHQDVVDAYEMSRTIMLLRGQQLLLL
jgi:hypothetical protein